MSTDDIHDLATRYLAARAVTIQHHNQYQCAIDTEAAIAMRLREALHGNQTCLVLRRSGQVLEIRDDGIEVHPAVILDDDATLAAATATAEPAATALVTHDTLAPLLQEFVRRAGGKRAKDLLSQYGQAARLSEVSANKLPALQAALVQALGGEA